MPNQPEKRHHQLKLRNPGRGAYTEREIEIRSRRWKVEGVLYAFIIC